MTGTNIRLPGVKRLLREAQELASPTSEYYATPLEENVFEWHFTIRGPSETPFENGIYHGRIIFPTDYPIKPPEIIFLTPNGRFQTDKKICLSVSSYHPELWRPCWGVRTMLLAIIGFFPSPPEGAIGSADISDSEKVRLAQNSVHWRCPVCDKKNKDILAQADPTESRAVATEAVELRTKIHLSQVDSDIQHIVNVQLKDSNTDQESPINEDLPIQSHTNEVLPSELPQTTLPFPWSEGHLVKIEKMHVNDIFPFVESDLLSKSSPVFNFVFPKYDWALEAQTSNIPDVKEKKVQPQPGSSQYIPHTHVLYENAYSMKYHLKSLGILILYLVLIVILGKKFMAVTSILFQTFFLS